MLLGWERGGRPSHSRKELAFIFDRTPQQGYLGKCALSHGVKRLQGNDSALVGCEGEGVFVSEYEL